MSSTPRIRHTAELFVRLQTHLTASNDESFVRDVTGLAKATQRPHNAGSPTAIHPSSAVYLTSGCCEDTGHISHTTLNAMGLATGIMYEEHYPLTAEEMALIAEEFIDFGPFTKGALIGYSALINRQKYLAPALEFGFNSKASHAQAKADALRCLGIIEHLSISLGGHYSVEATHWSDDPDHPDGHYRCSLFIPMSYALNHEAGADFERWTEHLNELATQADHAITDTRCLANLAHLERQLEHA